MSTGNGKPPSFWFVYFVGRARPTVGEKKGPRANAGALVTDGGARFPTKHQSAEAGNKGHKPARFRPVKSRNGWWRPPQGICDSQFYKTNPFYAPFVGYVEAGRPPRRWGHLAGGGTMFHFPSLAGWVGGVFRGGPMKIVAQFLTKIGGGAV